MKRNLTFKGIDLLFSFFAENEQIAYQTPYELIPQFNDDSCVAACLQMILADFGIKQPQSYWASALETSEGAFLSEAPRVLQDFGLSQNYQWQNNLSLTELNNALKQGSVIVSVKGCN